MQALFFFLVKNRTLDETLSSLGVAPISEVLSSLSSVNSMTSDTSVNATPEGSLQPASLNGTRYTAHKITYFCNVYYDIYLNFQFTDKQTVND